MELEKYQEEALRIRKLYEAFETRAVGKKWTDEDIYVGLVSDVGDLSRLVLAKKGATKVDNLQPALEHELSECLWALLVLAKSYDVDLESAFFRNMKELEGRLTR